MNFDFNPALKGQISAVATNGKLLFPAQTCKDYTRCGIGHGVHGSWAKGIGLFNPGVKNKKISLERPLFVYWSSPNTVERNAVKFTQIINQIETILDIPLSVAYPVDSGISDDSNVGAPFVAEADAWWLKSPVAIDAYLLLMRLSITMRLNEDLQVFFDRITGKIPHSKHAITRDAGYLTRAKKIGNLTGLLEKTMPCLNREEYSDHLLATDERGFSQYDIHSDSKNTMDEASLISKCL